MSNGMEERFRRDIEFYTWAVANKPWGVPLRLWLWACEFKWDRPWPEDDEDGRS